MREIRLYLRQECLINPPPPPPKPVPPVKAAFGVGAALAGIFVPKLIEAGIKGLGGRLKKAGEARAEQITAVEILDLYQADDQQVLHPNGRLRCVLGVWFDLSDDKPVADEIADLLRKADLLPQKAVLRGVFEAQIVASSDATAFYLETRYFRADRFLGNRWWSGQRDIVVTFSLSTPSAAADGTVFALGQIGLGKRRQGEVAVERGKALGTFPRYRSNLMPWSAISEASQKAHRDDAAAGTAAGKGYMPVAAALTITETADGNQFLAKLGELLADQADEAAGEISKRLLPAKIREAAAAEQTAADKLYEEELQARQAVAAAERELKAATAETRREAQIKLELAQRKLEVKSRLRKAAGLPDP